MEAQTNDILNNQFMVTANAVQQMIFGVETEEFGVDVTKVQEIIRYLKPFKVPNTPDFVSGVINFRGEVIPVLDLRRIFGLNTVRYDEFTVILVVQTGKKTFGMIVDRVLDIMNIPEANIQPPPELGSKDKTRYLKAMGQMGERLILMLDLEKIVNFREFEASLPQTADALQTAPTVLEPDKG